MSGSARTPRTKRVHDQEDAMSQSPFVVPAKPTEITLETLPQLFAHHKARFGGWTMTQTPPEGDPPAGGDGGGGDNPPPPERPDGISEAEWNALGDPGKQAILRERERAQAAERALAASRARPAPPKQQQDPPKGDPPKQDPPKGDPPKQDDKVDVAAIVKQAVDEAVKPFREAEERRELEAYAERVRSAVLDAAKPLLHDATDALANVDLAGVVDDNGLADPAKVKSVLDDLVKRKPHLAKSPQRQAPAGIGGGAPADATDGEKVKAALARMQQHQPGVRFAGQSS
jgi:hypothetical protein